MSTQEIMRLVSDYVSEYPNDTCGAKERAALEAAIESLTAERDAYAKAADDMAAAHKVERDELTARVGELNAARFAYASEFALDAEGHPDVGSIHQNIRALKKAARLALDALSEYGNPYNWDEDFHGIRRKWQEPKSNTPSAYNGFELAQPAITALKAVL